MKQFTGPKRKSQSSKPGNKQEQSSPVVEKAVYFFKGNASVFDITDFPFVKGLKIVDGVWCVFINNEYTEQQVPVVKALEKVGLSFIHEFTYTGSFEKLHRVADDFFRDIDFWKVLSLKKIKTREQFLQNI